MLSKKEKEVLSSYKGKYDLEVEINGKMFPIQEDVWKLILNISKERDELRNSIKSN